MKLNKLMTAACALGTMLPIINFSQVAMAVSPQYRVTTYFTIDRSRDGAADQIVEIYGEVRVNGALSGQISRGMPQPKRAGDTVGMGQRVVPGSSAMISATLMDRNTGSPDAHVFRMPVTQVNLAAIPNGGERTYRFVSPDSTKGSTLHVRVDRL
jgi:hypothetical protein